MIAAMPRTLVCLALGEFRSRAGLIGAPAASIGLRLMLASFRIEGGVPSGVAALSDRMTGLPGMLFVPAGVGLVARGRMLRAT